MAFRTSRFSMTVVAFAVVASGAGAQIPQGRAPVNATLIPRTDSTYIVVLGSDTLHVLPTSMVKVMTSSVKELHARRQEIQALESLQAPYERVVKACTDARTLDDTIIRMQGQQIADYKELSERLEKLKNPWMTWEFGFGKDSAGPALVGGIGLKRLRAWATVHEGRNGLFLGYSGRVF
jgi:hypothetical protein